ncbi:MAG: hypothetical protein EXR72_17550 [Myxococcales bacterium]|nr:hypothetical protein [Myxococcales bacterium]
MTTRDESKLYDVRTLERRMRRGVINKKDFEKYLKALPDCSANVAYGSVRDDETDDRRDD